MFVEADPERKTHVTRGGMGQVQRSCESEQLACAGPAEPLLARADRLATLGLVSHRQVDRGGHAGEGSDCART